MTNQYHTISRKSGNKMAEPSKLLTACSLLMASLFAYSASVQLNDQDWYFWLPLYASASVVNLFSNTYKSQTFMRIAKLAVWLGLFLFLKVVIEDYLHGLAGFFSLDLSQRVVREKMGSGLVVISMFLQLVVSAGSNDPLRWEKVKVAGYAFYGMAVLVILSFGLSLAFFVSH